MNKLLILLLAVALMTSCSNGGGDSSAPNTPPAPNVPITPPVVTPPVAPPVTPPTPTPPPVALVYNCTNHPLTNKTTVGIDFSLETKSDCSLKITYDTHITYGYWSPNPNPNTVATNNGKTYYPVTVIQSGQYQCLPLNGPQTCQNAGHAGNLYIVVDLNNVNYNQILSQ
jgi:hypothetical protein